MIHTLDYTGLIPPLDVYLEASSGWAGCASMLGPVELKDSISHFDQGVRILLGDWDCCGVYKKAVSRKTTLKSWTYEAPVRNSESLKMKDICKRDSIYKISVATRGERLQTFKFQTSFQIAASPAEDFNTVKVKWRNQSLSAVDRNHPEPW